MLVRWCYRPNWEFLFEWPRVLFQVGSQGYTVMPRDIGKGRVTFDLVMTVVIPRVSQRLVGEPPIGLGGRLYRVVVS